MTQDLGGDSFDSSVDDLEPLSSLEVLETNTVLTKAQAWSLYTSHFLSTWNMRMYEFAAIIFTAATFPNTLLAASVRGIVRTLAAICFSALVGRWIDRSPDRMKTLTTTIAVNRLAVVVACILWYAIVPAERALDHDFSGSLTASDQRPSNAMSKHALFTIILIIGVFEILSASGNTLCMERDWVVTASSPDGKPYDLTHLNSVMRRIDLICKLIAPIFISILISSSKTKVGVVAVGSMSGCSFIVEWLCARTVWYHNPKLRAPKNDTSDDNTTSLGSVNLRSNSLSDRIRKGLWSYANDFVDYFSSIVWIPSMALAILHISVLAYNATMITFLVNIGFRLDVITLARAVGSIIEISSTVVTPIGIQYLARAKNHGRYVHQVMQAEQVVAFMEDEAEGRGTEIGIFRLGLWGLNWQLMNLIPVILSLWWIATNDGDSSANILGIARAVALFFFLSTSRLGLWIYDLTTQQLTQTMTMPSKRSSFGGVENSFVNLFELLQNIVAIVLHRPEQFKYIAVMSLGAVAISTIMYASWVFKMRGHLVHWDTILKSCECVVTRYRG